MLAANTTKERPGLRYYTGSHPKIREHCRSGQRPTEFGNKVWATSLILLDYLEQKPFALQGLRVLEIGCGWGLLGVYLARAHSCQVTCTDLDENVLPIVQMHAALNNVVVDSRKATFADLSSSFLGGFDLIIGAEVCYSDEVAIEVIALIQRAFESGVNHILIADPGRPDFTDCSNYCFEHYNAELINLPGSINGKITQVLSTRTK